MTRLRVEVFPVAPDRWIGVIDAPRGAFSNEVKRPGDVEENVRRSIAAVLGSGEWEPYLVDDLGETWTPGRATQQLARLMPSGQQTTD